MDVVLNSLRRVYKILFIFLGFSCIEVEDACLIETFNF